MKKILLYDPELLHEQVDFRFRRTLSRGQASSRLGQHDVGHEGVASGRGALAFLPLSRSV